MTSLIALLVSTLVLSHIPMTQEEPKTAVQYFYAEAPEQYGSPDRPGRTAKRTERFMIIPPPPTKYINIWETIRLAFPPVDLSEKG